MNKNFKVITALFAVLALVSIATAGSVWNDADTASPLIVRYTGAETATIQVTASTIVQVTDGTTTTTTYNGQTLAWVVAALMAAQDDEGDKEWEVRYWGGIAADAIADNDLIVVAANAVTMEWDMSVKWDVSNEKHYDVVLSSLPVGKFSGDAGPVTLLSLMGEPTGTGDATVSVYVDGVRKFFQTITSPVYVLGVTNTTNVADAVIDLSDIDLGAGIHVGASAVAFVRCARATTATTGGIGASVSRP